MAKVRKKGFKAFLKTCNWGRARQVMSLKLIYF